MARRRPGKRAKDAANFFELQQWYDTIRSDLSSCKRELKIANTISRGDRADLVATRKEAKTANRQVITLTKKQKAADEAKQSAAWSGGAAIFVTILYQVFEIVGFPIGGHQRDWVNFWKHEAVNGVILWATTCVFALIYKMTKQSGSD